MQRSGRRGRQRGREPLLLVPGLAFRSELGQSHRSAPGAAESPGVEGTRGPARRLRNVPVARRPPALGTAGARRRAPGTRTLWPPSPPRAGVKEHPSPLVTETKTRRPSRRVKVQEAASPRRLPEGGGDPPRAPGRAGPFPLHPPLIKVGSLRDNRGERGRVASDLDFCGVHLSGLHCPLSDAV